MAKLIKVQVFWGKYEPHDSEVLGFTLVRGKKAILSLMEERTVLVSELTRMLTVIRGERSRGKGEVNITFHWEGCCNPENACDKGEVVYRQGSFGMTYAKPQQINNPNLPSKAAELFRLWVETGNRQHFNDLVAYLTNTFPESSDL